MNKRQITIVILFGLLGACLIERFMPHHKYARVFYNLGLEAEGHQQLEKAKKIYQTAIRINPAFPYSYYRLGILAYHKQDYRQAIDYFEKAVLLDPGLLEGFDFLGLSYTELGYYQRAIANFKLSVQVRNNLFFYHLGVAYVKSKDKNYADQTVVILRIAKDDELADKLERLIKSSKF